MDVGIDSARGDDHFFSRDHVRGSADELGSAAPRAPRGDSWGRPRWGCFAFLHGGRTRSPIVPAWFYGPSRKQFTAFGSADRSGWNGRKAMPFCKGWAPPALELRAGAPATTRSRVGSVTRRRPGGPVSRRATKPEPWLHAFAKVVAFRAH